MVILVVLIDKTKEQIECLEEVGNSDIDACFSCLVAYGFNLFDYSLFGVVV